MKRTIAVKAQHVRKTVPGAQNGDLLQVSGEPDNWRTVVDFSTTGETITFTLAGGSRRVSKFGRLVTVQRVTSD